MILHLYMKVVDTHQRTINWIEDNSTWIGALCQLHTHYGAGRRGGGGFESIMQLTSLQSSQKYRTIPQHCIIIIPGASMADVQDCGSSPRRQKAAHK